MQPAKSRRSEKGLTMLETLVGIMVIGVILFSITPPLLFAFATRLHNYRAQNAIRIAQGEIDRVRLLVQKGEYDQEKNWTKQLPPRFASKAGAGTFDLDNQVKAPDLEKGYKGACQKWVGTITASDAVTSWCSVDTNGDADIKDDNDWEKNWDLAVQTFLSSTPGKAYEAAGDQPIAFIMGVRVYTRAALKNSNAADNLEEYPRRKISIAAPGQSAKLPLVTRYEVIVRSDLAISRSTYCELTQSLGGSNKPCE